MKRMILFALALILGGCGSFTEPKDNTILMLVGTYLPQEEQSLLLYRFDTLSLEAELVASLEAISNPSYLTIDYSADMIYAVTEDNSEQDAVTAIKFNRDSLTLERLGRELTHGKAPCYITVDSLRSLVITANYNGGSISLFEMGEGGGLKGSPQIIKYSGSGLHLDRQEAAHLHTVRISPDGRYLFATDLGSDKIYRYDVGSMSRGDLLSDTMQISYTLKAGSGPRHIDFHPSGRWFYSINELSGEVAQFSYDDTIKEPLAYFVADSSYISSGTKGSADIHISDDGRYLYASNRITRNEVVAFAIDQESGVLRSIQSTPTLDHPRNFVITPDGGLLLVASRDGNRIMIFRRDKTTGLLTDSSKAIDLGSPVCIKFL